MTVTGRAGLTWLLLGSVLLPASSPAPDPTPVAVFRVEVEGAHGTDVATGVAVGPAFVLTVAHPLGAGAELRVDGRPACRIIVDQQRDAAVLFVPGLDADTVELADGAGSGPAWMVRLADVARTPLVERTEIHRIVARVATADDGRVHERAAVVVAAPVRPGDSGAPVLNAAGQLVGLVFAASRDDAAASYAVAVDELAPVVAATATPLAQRCGRSP